MKPRTCPHCGYRYSKIGYVKRLSFKTIWSEWDCPKCEQKITFDNMRRLLLALILGVYVFFLSIAPSYISLDFIVVVLYLVALFLGTMFIFTFDKFTKTGKLGWYIRCRLNNLRPVIKNILARVGEQCQQWALQLQACTDRWCWLCTMRTVAIVISLRWRGSPDSCL